MSRRPNTRDFLRVRSSPNLVGVDVEPIPPPGTRTDHRLFLVAVSASQSLFRRMGNLGGLRTGTLSFVNRPSHDEARGILLCWLRDDLAQEIMRSNMSHIVANVCCPLPESCSHAAAYSFWRGERLPSFERLAPRRLPSRPGV